MRLLATSAGTVSVWSNLNVTVFCFMASSWYSTTEPWTLRTVSRGPLVLRRLFRVVFRLSRLVGSPDDDDEDDAAPAVVVVVETEPEVVPAAAAAKPVAELRPAVSSDSAQDDSPQESVV